MNTVYLGEWNSRSVYQPEYDPQTWEQQRFPLPQVHKCSCCKIKWFRTTTNFYEGFCYYCWVEQFDGEEDIR